MLSIPCMEAAVVGVEFCGMVWVIGGAVCSDGMASAGVLERRGVCEA